MPLDHLHNPPDFGAKLRLHGNPGLPVPMLTASCSVGSTAWRGELWVCQQPPELSWWLADWVAGGGLVQRTPASRASVSPSVSGEVGIVRFQRAPGSQQPTLLGSVWSVWRTR